MSSRRQPAINPEVGQILLALDKPTGEIAKALRSLLLEQLPGIAEFPDLREGQIGYGFGPGYKRLICVILTSRSGVKLAFYRAVDLQDPHKFLEGKGRVHKFVVIRSLSDLESPALLDLIAQALDAYRSRSNPWNDRRFLLLR